MECRDSRRAGRLANAHACPKCTDAQSSEAVNEANVETVRAYTVLVILFLASLLMFFVGAIMGSPALALAGFFLTLGLFFARRLFKWEP